MGARATKLEEIKNILRLGNSKKSMNKRTITKIFTWKRMTLTPSNTSFMMQQFCQGM